MAAELARGFVDIGPVTGNEFQKIAAADGGNTTGILAAYSVDQTVDGEGDAGVVGLGEYFIVTARYGYRLPISRRWGRRKEQPIRQWPCAEIPPKARWRLWRWSPYGKCPCRSRSRCDHGQGEQVVLVDLFCMLKRYIKTLRTGV